MMRVEPSGQLRDEKLHAGVARFRNQNAQTTSLLAVEMFKKCTALWQEAHFQVKMFKKKPHVRSSFGS